MLEPTLVTQPDAIRYLQTVQQLYLELRGGGLMLSPLDVDRIRAWRDAGLPLELALQGLRNAHKAWADGGRGSRARPFALRNADRYVAELAAIHDRRSPGGPRHQHAVQPAASPSSSEPLPRRIAAALATRLGGARGAARAAYEKAIATLAAAPPALEIDRVLLAADEALGLAYLLALPRPERRPLVAAALREAGPRAGIPRRSYRAMLRSCLCEEARRHGNLIRPSDLP